jgi:hypothetical protein
MKKGGAMKKITILMLTLSLLGCDKPAFLMSGFEKFAYEGCVREGKYPNSICACNAASLDKALSDEDKENYKSAASGDLAASFKLMGMIGKLTGALQNCAK